MRTKEFDRLEGATAKLRATVVEYDDAPDECTMYPEDASEWERMTTWITAREGSFVDLEAWD